MLFEQLLWAAGKACTASQTCPDICAAVVVTAVVLGSSAGQAAAAAEPSAALTAGPLDCSSPTRPRSGKWARRMQRSLCSIRERAALFITLHVHMTAGEDNSKWVIHCGISVFTSTGPMDDVRVEVHKGAGGEAGSYSPCKPTAIDTGIPSLCTVTCTLTADDLTAGITLPNVTLEASIKANQTMPDSTINTTTAVSPATDVKYGSVQVDVSQNSYYPSNPATVGNIVEVTVSIKNTGPVYIGGITVHHDGIAFSHALPCASIDPSKVTQPLEAPYVQSCQGFYTIPAADVLPTSTVLNFTIDQTSLQAVKLQTALAGTATLNIPTATLYTSLSSCSVVEPAVSSKYHQLPAVLSNLRNDLGLSRANRAEVPLVMPTGLMPSGPGGLSLHACADLVGVLSAGTNLGSKVHDQHQELRAKHLQHRQHETGQGCRRLV